MAMVKKFIRMLFPAHAGVILYIHRKHTHFVAVPRTRGGDPCVCKITLLRLRCSPHTRG